MSPDFVMPITEEEWEKSGSKFASVGSHLSEAGMPEFREKAMLVPFTIVEEGEDNGKTGQLSLSFKKFSIGTFLEAVGVPVTMKNGNPTFDHALIPGKQFLSVWTKQVDTRSVEEGGKGTKYTKPTAALAIGQEAKVEELL